MAIIIDTIIIGILVLFTLYGIHKGALKSIVSLFGTLVSLIVSIYLVTLFGNQTFNVPFINELFAGESGSLASFFASKLPDFGGVTVGASQAEIDAALGGLWSVIIPIVTKIIGGMSGGAYQTETITNALAMFLSKSIFYIAFALVIFIVLRIIISMIEKFIEKIQKIDTIKNIDKFFGMFIGFIKGAIAVTVILFILGLVMNFAPMAPVKEAFESTRVAKEVSKIIFSIIEKYVNLDKFINGILSAMPGMQIV